MTDRLLKIADRLDITELLGLYCHALDSRQWERLAEVFAPDASCDYGSVGAPSGVQAITDAIRGTIGDLDATQHLVGSIQVAVHADTATASCHLISQHLRRGAEDGELYMLGGTYHDELVRTGAGWRISFRRLERLWTSGNRNVVDRSARQHGPPGPGPS